MNAKLSIDLGTIRLLTIISTANALISSAIITAVTVTF
jgi:hypothetical protein